MADADDADRLHPPSEEPCRFDQSQPVLHAGAIGRHSRNCRNATQTR
jgi:hypothetical protein